MKQNTIKAPNGTTSFIKPDFDVVLCEEVGMYVIGYIDSSKLFGGIAPKMWEISSGKCTDGSTYNDVVIDLTAVPQPWYNDPSNFPCYYKYNPHGKWLYMRVEFEDTRSMDLPSFEELGYMRITPEEATEYVAKQSN